MSMYDKGKMNSLKDFKVNKIIIVGIAYHFL